MYYIILMVCNFTLICYGHCLKIRETRQHLLNTELNNEFTYINQDLNLTLFTWKLALSLEHKLVSLKKKKKNIFLNVKNNDVESKIIEKHICVKFSINNLNKFEVFFNNKFDDKTISTT